MSDRHRRDQILTVLQSAPFASVRDLSELLDVSAATVRRDIDRLHDTGAARKVYGGISAIDGAAAHGVFARTYRESSDVAVAAKQAIALEASTMVDNGDAVIVHGGSTCFRLGEHLASRAIRLCTNSMPLAAMLSDRGTCTLTLAGSDLYREPGILHGGPPPDFFASKFFLSAQNVDDNGILESHPLLIEAASRFADRADRVIVLVDSSKFTGGARRLALPWSRIDTLVTDDGIDPDDHARIRDKGVEVRIAASAVIAP